MTLQAERIEAPDDVWQSQSFFEEKGWSDGLPVIPPTEERVAEMLAATRRKSEETLGTVPPRWAAAIRNSNRWWRHAREEARGGRRSPLLEPPRAWRAQSNR